MTIQEIAAAFNCTVLAKRNAVTNEVEVVEIVQGYAASASTKIINTKNGRKSSFFTITMLSANEATVKDNRNKNDFAWKTVQRVKGCYEFLLTWKEDRLKEKSAKRRQVLELAERIGEQTKDQRATYVLTCKNWAISQYGEGSAKIDEVMKASFDTYEESTIILAERAINKEMNIEKVRVGSFQNIKGGKMETLVTDGELTFVARVIIASGPIQRPHYRYIFS